MRTLVCHQILIATYHHHLESMLLCACDSHREFRLHFASIQKSYYLKITEKNGEENGNPLQYSCLENSMPRGAWRATVHGVNKELDTTEATRQPQRSYECN